MRTHVFLFPALVLAALTPSAFPQRCLPQDTPRQCLGRLVAARAYEAAQAETASATTGTPSLSSPARSAVKDFLSAASAHLEGSSVKDSGAALVLDYNLPGSLLGARRQVNLEVTLADPVASPAVASESDTSTAAATEIRQLGRGDDVAAAVSFNPVTKRFGRSLDPHRKLFDSMLLTLIGNAAPATAAVPAGSYDTPFAQTLPDAAAQAAAIAEFETAANTALSPAAEQLKTDMARLANNQPQLFATALYHERKAAVGPIEHGVRVTWEIGSDNINSFRQREGRDCEAKGNCLAALNEYFARTEKEHHSGRLSLGIEYGTTSVNDPNVTAPAFTEASTHGIKYLATWGQEMTSFLSGRQGRIDLTLIHEGHKTTRTLTTPASLVAVAAIRAEPAGRVILPSSTRRSAAITFTQPVSDRISIPISVVVADRNDSFPGSPGVVISPPVSTGPFIVHRRETAVLAGITYKVPDFSPPSKPRKECCCR